MKKLISIFAAGALVLAVSATALAAGPTNNPGETTQVQVDVNSGTTIYAPAGPIVAGSGYPGQTGLASDAATVEWISNETSKYMTIVSSDLTCIDESCGSATTPDVIGADHVQFSMPTYASWTAINTAQQMKAITLTNDDVDSQAFKIRVNNFPSVRIGTYQGTLTFAAQ